MRSRQNSFGRRALGGGVKRREIIKVHLGQGNAVNGRGKWFWDTYRTFKLKYNATTAEVCRLMAKKQQLPAATAERCR